MPRVCRRSPWPPTGADRTWSTCSDSGSGHWISGMPPSPAITMRGWVLTADPILVRSESPDGFTALHLAAFFGRPETVAVLIEMRC